ncbi:MAG: type II toxin-antitoxin system RelE/ParE family toxin [Flavobacteriales bacterium]|nr:type II toxin-antitoxin system RelE/ParE family toxin [Flavobacteriales bacterium]
MSYSLVVHHAAYQELDEAERYIEARRTGYGRKFRDEVSECLTFIQERPTGYAKRRDGFRYGMVTKFPYRVIYKVEGDVIFIAAVYHGKRKPFGWKDRQP